MSYDPEMIITLFKQWLRVEYERHAAIFLLSKPEDSDFQQAKTRVNVFKQVREKLEELEND